MDSSSRFYVGVGGTGDSNGGRWMNGHRPMEMGYLNLPQGYKGVVEMASTFQMALEAGNCMDG